jgi:hypothetical protein
VFSFLAAAVGQGSPDPKQQTDLYGSSGGNVKDTAKSKCCSGTLGSLVFAGTKKYILSNNHVIGRMGNAVQGEAISQPGLVDTQCKIPRSVGNFTVASPISDNVDAAIAELIDGTMNAAGTIMGVGTPSPQTAIPAPKMQVIKSGRSTGITQGVIQSYPTEIKVNYSSGCQSATVGLVDYKNQIIVVGNSGSFSTDGDSGSLILTTNKNPVGLLVAGSSTLTVANPIEAVLESLSKKLGSSLGFGLDINLGIKAESAQAVESHASAQNFADLGKLVSALMSEPAVIGIGTAGTSNEPELILYVQKDKEIPVSAMRSFGITVNAQGAEYRGQKTTIVRTDPIRAFCQSDRNSRQ